MNINSDLKKIAVVCAICCVASSIFGAALTVLVHSRYTVPHVSTQAASKLDSLKLDSRFDRLVLEVEGHLTQTTNLIEAQQSDSTVVFSVSNDGDVGAAGTLSVTGGITFAGSISVVNVDASGYVSATTNITAATLAATGLTSGRVPFATTGGQLTDDTDLTFATDTLTVTNIGAYTLTGKLTAGATEIEGSGFDINGGTIDGAIIGGASAAAGTFTTIDASGVTELDGGFTVDDTAFTVADTTGNTVISGTLTVTDTSDFIGNVADSGGDFTIADDVDITLGLDVQGGNITLQNDEIISNTTDGTIALHIADADEWDFTADQLDATNGQIVNIGAAGTDFSGTGGLTLADALTISSGDATVAGDVDAAGEVQVGTFLNFTAATFITVTNGAVFTPTATYQPINAAGEVTPTISVSGFTAGDELRLVNESAQTINLADSGTAKLSAAWAAGQYDVLVLLFDGTNWLEIGRSDN